ncbi:MAG: hypothetical protein EPN26_16890 [Rhodospirillales bacterium]|nr:MAG: hypothetical protein EPN26_16890 [Rhodospirillales bacterium]
MFKNGLPLEADDSYGYMLKAVQMDECFRHECPALRDLSRQFTFFQDETVASHAEPFRQFVRVISFYHPGHTLLLSGLHGLGLSYEDAMILIQGAGFLLLAVGLAAFLTVLFGPGPAMMALPLLAISELPGHGFGLLFPSNLAFAVALIVWVVLAARWRHSAALLLAGIAVMLSLHPVGKAYALATILMYLGWNGWPVRRRVMTVAGLGIVLTVAVHVGFAAIDKPPFGLWRPEWPALDTTSNLAGNAAVAWTLLRSWAGSLWGVKILAPLLLLGMLAVLLERNRRVLVAGLVLSALVLAAVAYPTAGAHGEAFKRLFPPLAVILCGLLGAVVWRALEETIRSFAGKDAILDRTSILSGRGWRLFLSAIVLVLFAHQTVNAAAARFRGFGNDLAWFSARSDKQFDPGQVRKLLDETKPGEPVLYLAETSLYFYLMEGANARGAVYAPAVLGRKEQSRWLEDKTPRWLVGEHRHRGHFRLGPDAPLSIRLPENATPQALTLTLSGEDGEPGAQKAVLLMGRGDVCQEPLAASSEGTQLRIPKLAPGQTVCVSSTENLLVTQIKTAGQDAGLSWPWDSGLEFVFGKGADRTRLSFDTTRIAPWLPGMLRIIEDTGASFLAEIGSPP